MPRPTTLTTRIFLDSGSPDDTRSTLDLLGFLDGQTTNPSLVAKALRADNPDIALKQQELMDAYKGIVQNISQMIPHGSVSIEVYGDKDTVAETMITQGREMNTWIPNAHIKLPTTKAGLEAANVLTGEGVRVNMTLIFSQAQAAAVHAATFGAKKGDVFLSPFVGRLDDRGENGIDLISRISDMYKKEESHVEILTASVRNIDHFLASIAAGTDIITCPKKILDEWAASNFITPEATYSYTRDDLSSIPDASVSLTQSWQEYNIQHDLTDTGLQKFADDWNALIA